MQSIENEQESLFQIKTTFFHFFVNFFLFNFVLPKFNQYKNVRERERNVVKNP